VSSSEFRAITIIKGKGKGHLITGH